MRSRMRLGVRMARSLRGLPLRRVLVISVSLAGLSCAIALSTLAYRTAASIEPLPASLAPALLPGHQYGASEGDVGATTYFDRTGQPLGRIYPGDWNVDEHVPLEEIPELLRQAFVAAEDKRFYHHHGVDWRARFAATWQNLRALRVVRGASTISEQSVRILRPRPRTPWSRWLEGFEAGDLEQRFTKSEILEFYLNQVPYARQRRGVAQAARLYFGRELGTLSARECVALAVLVRSPSRLDPLSDPHAALPAMSRLAHQMHARGQLDERELASVLGPSGDAALVLRTSLDGPESEHFRRFAATEDAASASATRSAGLRRTTLDAGLQSRVQEILDRGLLDLAERHVADGAVLVVDHQTDEVLAWVNGFGFTDARDGGHLDKVLLARQPGSTLKPLLYAQAMEQGWTAATVIDDAPLAEAVGHGMHSFRNYSRTFYGPVRLRTALGNSLNTPAVRAVRHVGTGAFLERLRTLGIESLDRDAAYYGDGLALGNGEVSLFELVGAYATLGRGGEWRPIRVFMDAPPHQPPRQVIAPDVASILGDVLSDPRARALEFGAGSVLELPHQTAVKTGTSNDHRDAWALGFDHRFTVGVWMGNADRSPTESVSGAVGPALVLRAVFAELARRVEPRPLVLQPTLERAAVCAETGLRPGALCPVVGEWFQKNTAPAAICPVHGEPGASAGILVAAKRPATTSEGALRLVSPTPGLHLALDPRIPDELEAFVLRAEGLGPGQRLEWLVDGEVVARTDPGEQSLPWQPVRGRHRISARVIADAGTPDDGASLATQSVGVLVK